MGFDLFLKCFREGEKATFKRELFEEIIGRGAVDARPPLSTVEYADGSGGEIYGADSKEDEEIDHLMFAHFSGDTLMARLWELADRTGSCFIWPSDGRCLAVTRVETVGHIPAGLVGDHGPPFVVHSGDELDYVIGHEEDPPKNLEPLAAKTAEWKAAADRITQVVEASRAKAGGQWRVDPYGIFGAWAVRPENPDQLARRMVQSLDSLSDASPLLRGWLVSDHYPPKMAYHNQHTIPLAIARDKMKAIVEACAWGGESLGYHLGAAVSDITSPRFVEFRANAGGHSEHGPGFRCATLSTNRFADADPELATCPLFKAALLALVRAWEPEFAIARSHSLYAYSRGKSAPFAPAWMTYLSASLARQIVPPPDVHVEHDDAGGILMIAAEEKFDVENPEHIGAAERICAAVSSIDATRMPVFRDRQIR
jgi:hypothetical protein